ncbi:MAG: hypothetical protein H8E44_01260 [Planctomycetes bacterium]|nr:hypothetical protein [Planctomycetota bacterium]MBL7044860.1 hypothetical protein [Pirellulaceae bacterium]
MSKRPQFSLKAILVIIAVLAVPMALFATRNEQWEELGVILLFPVVGGCWGYVTAGWKGIAIGVSIGFFGLLFFLIGVPLLNRYALP